MHQSSGWATSGDPRLCLVLSLCAACEDIPLDDGPTYRLFSEGKTEAVFQFESRGMQGMLRDARPTRLEDLIALCLGAGLYFSIRTRFMQVRGIPEMLRLMFRGRASEAGVYDVFVGNSSANVPLQAQFEVAKTSYWSGL